jgi:hypothetical protein
VDTTVTRLPRERGHKAPEIAVAAENQNMIQARLKPHGVDGKFDIDFASHPTAICVRLLSDSLGNRRHADLCHSKH